MILKNKAIAGMKMTLRKIVNAFPHLPNFMVKIMLIMWSMATIPAMMKSSDLCAQRLGLCEKEKTNC